MGAAQGAGASPSVPANLSGSVKSRMEVAEYSGVGTVGLTATNTGSGTSLTIALTTQSSNSWAVAGFGEKNGTSFSPPSIGNLRDSGSFTSTTTVGAAVNDNTAASPSSVTNAVTMNTSGPWAAVALELRPSLAPAPTVTGIAPTSGTTAGGTTVTITGTGFLSGASVTLGGTAATNVAVGRRTSVTATTPVDAGGA